MKNVKINSGTTSLILVALVLTLSLFLIFKIQQQLTTPLIKNSAGLSTQAGQTMSTSGQPPEATLKAAVGKPQVLDNTSAMSPADDALVKSTDAVALVNPFTVDITSEPVASATADTQGKASAANVPVRHNRPRQSIAPSSFPVEDAAKYFIPRGQATVGNLGGPPPFPNIATLPASEQHAKEPLSIFPPPITPGQ